MFKKKIMKMLALVLVLNVLIIPLSSFAPQEQNKYKVMAAEGIVDIKFYNAIISMIGITAAGLATMSPSFSIPEADIIEMKNNFAQSLESDATKKAAWMKAQTEYLAGGVAKTMGAVELSKIGINDIYTDFMSYLKTNVVTQDSIGLTVGSYTMSKSIINQTYYAGLLVNNKFTYYPSYGCFYANATWGSYVSSNKFLTISFMNNSTGTPIIFDFYREDVDAKVLVSNLAAASNYPMDARKFIYSTMMVYGLNMSQFSSTWLTGVSLISGTVTNTNNIINATDTTRSIVPTIPWIGTDIPIGTVVTPAISIPYAGTVPIDVPISVPIDPPIDEPVDPPAEPNLIGTVAAILAGLTPIAGFLEYILAGQVSLTDTIEAAITGVIDSIGDIAGTLTGGITSTLTDIKTAITDFVNPSPETVSQLDLNPIKNIPGVLFTRFPFSIPFDFYNIISFMGGSAREAPVFEFKIDLSSLTLPDIEKQIDMQPFNQIAGYVRIAELLAFAIAVMLKTKTLIWG